MQICILSSFAQTKNITISGTVIEENTKEPISKATIQLLLLPDSIYTTGAVTTVKGEFTLPKVTVGKYILKITYIGFHTKIIPIQLSSSNTYKNIGTIPLQSDAIMLQEAVVTSIAPPVIIKADTTEYNASAYRVPEGAMLEELVKKLPGAEISNEGKITVNGKEIKKIMVDGKEFFSDDPKVAMKNLPVNMVEKVKAYDRKSDTARITGIDDGEEETILDLTVKKGMKQGWIGNLITGYGSENRYEAGGILSKFLDSSNFSIIGSANNTNNQGFSEFGDLGQGFSNNRAGAGITSSKSLGINFAKDAKKIQFGGNLKYGYSSNDAKKKNSTERFLLNEGSSFGNSTDTTQRKSHNIQADLRLEWRLDTLTTIIFRPNISYSHANTFSSSWSETLNNNHNQVNNKNEIFISKSDSYSLNGRFEAYRKLSTKGRNISLRALFGYSDSESNSSSESETLFYDDNAEIDSTLLVNRHTRKDGNNKNWSISASYTEPIFKMHYLQLRYEYAHRNRLSKSLVYDNLTDPNLYVDSLSSEVENFYNTHSIDASIRGMQTKMMYSAGLTLIPQSSRSITTIGPNASNHLPTQSVFNFSPQIMLRYMFNKQHVLMFRYRGRSSEPNIEDLQQVIDQTNPLNIRYGNPNLKPSFTHNVMLFYNKYIPEYMRSYSLNLFYTATNNSVVNKTYYNSANGGIISQKVNVNGNWNARSFFSFNTPLKNKKFTISSNTNASFSDNVSYTQIKGKNDASDAELSTTHNLQIGERLTGNYRIDKFDISLNGSINYSLTRNSKQKNSNRKTFDYYVGGNTNITLPWQFYLSTDANYRIKDGYSGNFNSNEFIWNAQLSKSFLKNNAATIRFKIYDILKQQSNLSRSISETLISDTEYNTLRSYFMVHFVYKLNTLGGKVPASNRGFESGRRKFESGERGVHGQRSPEYRSPFQ